MYHTDARVVITEEMGGGDPWGCWHLPLPARCQTSHFPAERWLLKL